MIEIPHNLPPTDVRQWLEGGVFYAQATEGGRWRLATLRGMPDFGVIQARFITEGQSAEIPHERVRAHWPQCGAINVDGFALYVQRQQRRQYRRTFNSRCINVSVPGKWQHLKALDAARLQVDTSDVAFLKALFEPTYYNVDSAFGMLRERPSVAVTSHLILVDHPDTSVYYRGQLAGRINGNTFHTECAPQVAKRVQSIIGGLNVSQ